MDSCVYVDHAATTPVHPSVVRAMAPFASERFGNPSSLYRLGREAQVAIDRARDDVAAVLGCRPGEVIFTSGGTESINLALKGVGFAQQLAGVGDRIVSTAVEHHAVMHTLEFLERFDFEIVHVPVDPQGRVEPADVAAAVDERTVLVNVMLANNEVGAVQPVAAIAEALRERAVELGRRVPFHTDAVQAPGQLPLEVEALGVDLLSISAHKFRGPKGVGALFLRRGTPFLAQQTGGGQERARRAGTENPGGIVGMALALELAEQQREAHVRHVRGLRDRFVARVLDEIPGATRNGPTHDRLANNANVGFQGVDGQLLLQALDDAGIAASSGSACTASSWEPSHVLLAMGADQDAAAGSLRCSFGLENSREDVDLIVERLREIVLALRGSAVVAP